MFTVKLKKKKKESIFFQKNGAAILEQIINSFDGNCNPIRNYSIQELNKATNNFAWEGMIHEDVNLQVYKAAHEDRQLLVKKYYNEPSGALRPWSDLAAIANEVAIASQMSKHKNVLKLLGCCLDTELPMLVYEFPENGILNDHCPGARRKAVLPWETKLKIATDIADAVAYLHHGFSKTFIHRDLGPSKIFLDKDYVAKLSEFRISIPIPEGKTHVDAMIMGTKGFAAPEVVTRGRLTERSDVYDFGILLGVLLTEKSLHELRKYLNCNSTDLRAELKANVSQQGNENQVMECSKLIERCISKNTEDRPDMIEVAKELRFIRKNIR